MANGLGNYLREVRGDRSLREVAKMCNISHTHLDSIEKGVDPRTGKRVRVTTETLYNIHKGLNLDYLNLAALAEEENLILNDGVTVQVNNPLKYLMTIYHLSAYDMAILLNAKTSEIESFVLDTKDLIKNIPEKYVLQLSEIFGLSKEDIRNRIVPLHANNKPLEYLLRKMKEDHEDRKINTKTKNSNLKLLAAHSDNYEFSEEDEKKIEDYRNLIRAAKKNQ